MFWLQPLVFFVSNVLSYVQDLFDLMVFLCILYEYFTGPVVPSYLSIVFAFTLFFLAICLAQREKIFSTRKNSK